ncbi:MAG: hypothetical protein ACWGSQ_11965 [Longimicrobiales bacterium]
MKRLNERIRRSKRTGKIVLGGVLLVSLILGAVLVQAFSLALTGGRWGLVWRAAFGLVLLLALDAFSIVLTRRQHRRLDEAREELRELVDFSGSHQTPGA